MLDLLPGPKFQVLSFDKTPENICNTIIDKMLGKRESQVNSVN